MSKFQNGYMINMSMCNEADTGTFQNHPESRPKLYNNYLI